MQKKSKRLFLNKKYKKKDFKKQKTLLKKGKRLFKKKNEK